MKGGSNDTSKCTVQAKHGRNGKVVFANLPRLGYSLVYGYNIHFDQVKVTTELWQLISNDMLFR